MGNEDVRSGAPASAALIVITGPPGSGKSTLARTLQNEFGIERLRPFTTRPRRPDEEPPNHEYEHVTRKFAEEQVASGSVHSSDIVADNIYGLLWSDLLGFSGIRSLIAPAGRIHKLRDSVRTLDFSLQPRGGELELSRRMRCRGEDEDAIEKRMQWGRMDTQQLPGYGINYLTDGSPSDLAKEVMRIARVEGFV